MYHNKTLWNLLVLITRGRVSRFVISFIPSQMIAEALEAQSGNEAVRLKVHIHYPIAIRAHSPILEGNPLPLYLYLGMH